jgi:hypothetical protein
VINATFVKEQLIDNFMAPKIHRQFPLVLLLMAVWKLGKDLGSAGFTGKMIGGLWF